VHHRRFDFQIVVPHEELADRLNDPGARDEYLARFVVCDEVEITLAIFLFLIGQAVELLRQRAQCLRQQTHLSDAHRKLARLGFEQHTRRAENVAEVVMLELVVRLFAGVVVADEQLDAPAHVLHRGKTRLAHYALQHHASRYCDRYLCGFQFVMCLVAIFGMQAGSHVLALEVIGEGDAFFADRLQLGAALRHDLVLVLRWDVLFGGHGVSW